MLQTDLSSLFPALAGRTYLDAATTSLVPTTVVAALAEELALGGGAGRSVHALGQRASDAFARARREVSAHLKADPAEVIWTRSATEALNLVAAGWGRRNLRPGDEVLMGPSAHHSLLLPWRRVCEATGARLISLACTPEGELDVADVRRKLTKRARVLAVTHVSNVTGAVSPLIVLRSLLDDVSPNALFVVDGAQAVPHLDVDLERIDCDAYAFSAHKAYGPPGAGVLWMPAQRQEECTPLLVGGGMVTHVRETGAAFVSGPERFEAGTPNVAGAVGTAAGLGFTAQHRNGGDLAHVAAEALRPIDGLTLVGDPKTRVGVCSFALDGIHSHDFGTFADDAGVALRVGHHCAEPLLRALGHASAVRASFGVYNTSDDVDQLADVVRAAMRMFRR